MKVVLFCGGQGTRLRDFDERTPKPLVPIGKRPILWHLMRYYAHFGHDEFILCLGYGGAQIKDYFLNYDECVSNDFVLSDGGKQVDLLTRDIDSWRITFVDTGDTSNIGERLRRVRSYIGDDEVFLANYADALCDLDLGTYVDSFLASGTTACFLSVPMPYSLHVAQFDGAMHVTSLTDISKSSLRINGGFFALRRSIFDEMNPNEELVVEPFARLIERRELITVAHDGFWHNMDTFKDKIHFDEIYASGVRPWQLWLADQ